MNYDLEDKSVRWNVAWFFLLYCTVSLAAVTLFIIVPLKKIIGRDRPEKIKGVKRVCNMRDLEHGNKSMPSGDTLAASFVLSEYAYIFGLSWWFVGAFVICVGIGRVYVHCHWIGDTIFGAVIGRLVVFFFFSAEYFPIMAMPFFKAVCG